MQTHSEKPSGFTFRKSLFIKVLICVPIIMILGASSGIITSNNVDVWFETLTKPPLNPPNYLFGIVWSILYAMMGISLALIWHIMLNPKNMIVRNHAKFAIILFSIHFAVNLLWTVIFFGYHEILFALVDIILLIILLLLTMKVFYRLDKRATYLLMPYFFWVCFATYLNLQFYLLN